MEYMFHAQCFLDLSKDEFVLALESAESRKLLERQCALLQEAENRHRAEGHPRGHAVMFRKRGLCWGWLGCKGQPRNGSQ
jgi:hypothetical protein